jgi:tight adherence protein B
MLEAVQQILAHDVLLYLSHGMTWVSFGVIALLFRRQISRALDRVNQKSKQKNQEFERDRFVGVATAVGVFSLCMLIDANLVFSIFIAAFTFIVTPIFLSKRRIKKYQKEFDMTLAESLATVSSSLRAGLTLKDSLVVAAQNCSPAFSREITKVLKDYRFGLSIDQALDGVRKRVQTANANISFGALIIGTQLGGKVPDILARIISTIREVDRVEGRLKALTAQGKAQGVLLCSMPILVTAGLYMMDREKIEFMMISPVGKILITVAVFLEIVGILVTLKVMKLDV